MTSGTRVINPVTGRQIFLCPMNWDNGQFEDAYHTLGALDFFEQQELINRTLRELPPLMKFLAERTTLAERFEDYLG